MAQRSTGDVASVDPRTDYETFLVYRPPRDVKFKQADKKYLWIKDKKSGSYLQAEVIDESDDTIIVARIQETGVEEMVEKEEAHFLNPAKFDGVNDCAQLSHLSEASVLYNLKLRYDANIIYTYSGLFCVAINPYRRFPIYHDGIIKMYIGRRRDELAPHVFAVADESYRCLLNDRRNQSMLVTGESGAGKTENTKKIIQYLAAIAGKSGSEGQLEKQLLQCNPLLEGLGNAKTTKNNNSSRFGKFIKITFGNNSFISGGSVVSYLLEKSRVVHRGQNERSFHIFYQMIEGLPKEQKNELYLKEVEDYKYLALSNCYRVEGMDDARDFDDTNTAMKVLEFNKDDRDTLFKVVAAILHLGNIEFRGDEVAEIVNPENLKKAADLLQVDENTLANGIIKPRISVGRGELIAKALNPRQSVNNRDALSKAIYNRLFLWVVDKINRTLKVKDKDLFIGILDIAGFEIFQHNSFEQLCINFTNERLQQFFNNHMFNLEQEEYRREKIEWKMINFGIDSQATIDLISKPNKCILSILNEECIMPNGTDDSFTRKLINAHGTRHPKFRTDQLAKSCTFIIDHYAGQVTYDTNEWLYKNKDPLENDLELCISSSKNQTLGTLFRDFALNTAAFAAAAEGGKQTTTKKVAAMFTTVGTAYQEQLNALMDTLGNTNPHFVRCIIPNHKKVPGDIDDNIVLDQLACNGVLEGIKISRLGFPNRLIYKEFHKRYFLLTHDVPPTAPDSKNATQKIISKLINDKVVDESRVQYGVTKIFFRVGEMAKIEEAREKHLSNIVKEIQACARGYIGRKVYEKKRQRALAVATIQKNIRAYIDLSNWPWFKLFNKIKNSLKVYSFEMELQKAKKAVETLQKQIDDAKAETTKAQLKVDSLEEEAEALKGVVQKEQASFNQLTEELQAVEAEKKRLARAFEDLLDESDKKATSLTSLDGTQKELEDRIDELERQTNTVSADIDKIDKGKKNVERQLLSLKEELHHQDDDNQTLKRENQRLDEEFNDQKDNLNALKTAKDTLDRNRKKLQIDIDDNTEDVESRIKENKDLAAAVQKLSEQTRDTLRELDDKKANRTSQETQSTKLKSELDAVTSDLENENKNRIALEKNQETNGIRTY